MELDTFKAERQALAESWGALKRRLDAALTAKSKATETTPLRGGRVGSLTPQADNLPPAQLAKVGSRFFNLHCRYAPSGAIE